MAPNATDEQIKNDLITGYSDLQGLGCKQAAYDNIAQRPDEPVRSYIVRYSRLFKLLNGSAPNEVRMRTTSMHFVNSLRSYLSSKVENRLLGMNERNYSLGDTFIVALQCELKAIASERRHNKRNTITINNVNSEDQDHTQLEDTQEVHVRNPNYKGANCFLPELCKPLPVSLFRNICKTVAYGACAVLWGMFVRGCARRDLC